jgi:TolB-like protein/Flp pilus assembly protein TadD
VSIYRELKRRNVLRVGAAYVAAAWLLIQITNTLFPLFGLSDTASRIVVIGLAIGFVPALLLAWLFELTPAGLKRESATAHADAADPRTVRRFDRAVMVVLSLALVLFAIDRFVLDPARDARLVAEAAEQARSEARLAAFDKSIAVLPFADLSAAGDQEYFADGIAEELLNLLAKVPDLRVAARTSAFSFKGKNVTVGEIAEALNVGHVLEGSVRVAGDTIRITAQLIEAETDTHLWSETYERPMGDVFGIQDEIAAEVVEQLEVTLLGPAPVLDETTPEVYALYLQARHINNAMLIGSLPLARELMERAIELDPDYFPARQELGRTYWYLQIGNPNAAEVVRLHRANLEATAAKWPDRPEIDASRGWLAIVDGQYETAARYLERALSRGAELEPLGSALVFLIRLGRFDEAIIVGRYLIAREPVCYFCHANLMHAYYLAGRYDEAIAARAAAHALGLDVDLVDRREYFAYGFSLFFTGDLEAALTEFQAIEQEGVRLMASALALHALGRTSDFDAAFAELTKLVEGRPGLVRAPVFAYIGDLDSAFEILDQVPRQRPDFYDLPWLAPMRNHPRWPDLAAKAGLWPEDSRDSISFNYELPE